MKNFKTWGIRIRKDLDRNYYSVWNDLETVRLDLGETIPLSPGKSEFYDVGITERCNSRCQFCFSGETLVNTENGYKKIKNLKVGDLVYSKNMNTNNIELKPVDQIFKRLSPDTLIKITLESGKELEVTENHELFTINRGWVLAKDLTEEDELGDIYNDNK